MAARESQGLQIAAIVFFMLFIICLVTTYIFFRNYKDEQTRANALAESSRKDQESARKEIDENQKLKELIGFAADEQLQAVVDAHAKDIASYGAGLKPEQQSYRALSESLAKTLSKKNQELADTGAKLVALQSQMMAYESTKDEQVKSYKDGMDRTAKDLAGEVEKYKADRGAFTEVSGKLQKELEGFREQIDTVTKTAEGTVAEIGKQMNTVRQINEGLTRNLEEVTKETIDVPDGKITWVNHRDRLVWVNVGSDDGARKQVTFSVYNPDDINIIKAERKGSIEITRVVDRHLSEGRVLEDASANPIVSGDLIYSPLWDAGKSTHFALAGFLDVDGDGTSDRNLVRDLISLQGGVIDAEADDKGNLTGELSINTRFLVLGDEPTERKGTEEAQKGQTPQEIDGFSRLDKDASLYGVEKISVDEFLKLVGYVPNKPASATGPGSAGTTDSPTGISARTPGSFRTRQPTALAPRQSTLQPEGPKRTRITGQTSPPTPRQGSDGGAP